MAFLLKKHTENYTCLSADTKLTTVQAGSKCEEIDTGKEYIFDGTDWNEIVGATSLTGSLAKASDTITIGTGAAHGAGDVVSTDAGEILQFETGLAAGTGGVILGSLVTLNQNAVFSGGAGYTLYLWNILASATVQATNAAFDLDNLTGYVGKIDTSVLADAGSNCVAEDNEHNKSFALANGDTKLYGKLVCKGAETTITGKVLTINLNIAVV